MGSKLPPKITVFSVIKKVFNNFNQFRLGLIKVIIDNDRYSMTVNDVEILWIANGKVYTPEISVSKKMEMFGYTIEKDENGNVNCEYVGGGS